MAKMIEVIKTKIKDDLFADQSNYKVLKALKYILKAETKTTTKRKSVVGIKTLLNTTSITLQNKRESNQEGSSKQNASITPPLVKHIKP